MSDRYSRFETIAISWDWTLNGVADELHAIFTLPSTTETIFLVGARCTARQTGANLLSPQFEIPCMATIEGNFGSEAFRFMQPRTLSSGTLPFGPRNVISYNSVNAWRGHLQVIPDATLHVFVQLDTQTPGLVPGELANVFSEFHFEIIS